MLQHVNDPGAVLAQLRRVVRPGGSIALVEPDWDTLIVDDVDVDVSRTYSRFVATRVVRNGAIGRQLARLGARTGLLVCKVEAEPLVYHDLAVADRILRLASVVQRRSTPRRSRPRTPNNGCGGSRLDRSWPHSRSSWRSIGALTAAPQNLASWLFAKWHTSIPSVPVG